MKKSLLFAPVIWIAATSLWAQPMDAVKYFEFLNNEHVAIVSKSLEYVQYSVHSKEAAEVETKRLALIMQISQSLEKVKKQEADKSQAHLREEMLSVLTSYLESFNVEFKVLTSLRLESENSFEAMDQYLTAQDAAEKKLSAAADRFLNAQRDFAKKNNILLVESDRNSEINQINRLNNYHRAVFLRYFKISKRNAAFLDAMGKQDGKEMSKILPVLQEECKQEWKKLQAMPDFNGDTGFRDANVKIVEFIKGLAEGGYAKVTAAFQKKGLSQEDVGTFNEVVETFNSQFSKLIDDYNQASDRLFKNNVPKPALQTKQI